MKPLFEHSVIGPVQRLGIRYINRFNQVRISDRIYLSVQVGGTIPPTYRQQVRTEFEQNGFRIVLTIVDGYPVEPLMNHITLAKANKPDETVTIFSLIDVDVIRFFDPRQPNSFENLLSTLEAAHTEEKFIFFSLLKPEFLESLNPVY